MNFEKKGNLFLFWGCEKKIQKCEIKTYVQKKQQKKNNKQTKKKQKKKKFNIKKTKKNQTNTPINAQKRKQKYVASMARNVKHFKDLSCNGQNLRFY